MKIEIKVDMSGAHDYFGALVDQTIQKAKSGDVEAAKKLMEWYCGAIAANTDEDSKPHRKPSGTGTQIDERILWYFGECFQNALSGVKINRAMNLEKPKHRLPDPKKKERDIDLAIEAGMVGYGKKEHGKQLEKLEKIGGADKGKDGEFMKNRSQSKIKAVYKEYKELADAFVELDFPSILAELDKEK